MALLMDIAHGHPARHLPALFTPANGAAFTNVDGTAENVSASAPLPVPLSSPGTVSASEGSGCNGGVGSDARRNFMGGSLQVTNAGTTCRRSLDEQIERQNQRGHTAGDLGGGGKPSADRDVAPQPASPALSLSAAFLRTRVSTYTSGTVSVVLNQKPQVVPGFWPLLSPLGVRAIGSVSVTGTVR